LGRIEGESTGIAGNEFGQLRPMALDK
jgi:hypothetical protein